LTRPCPKEENTWESGKGCGLMATKILIGLAIAVTVLLAVAAAWHFSPPPPEICLDGQCYEVKP